MMKPLCSAALILSIGTGHATANPRFDPDGPFVEGEAMPRRPASCETLPDWIDRVPAHDGRISMAIEGVVRESHWDGVLAYLVMCGPDQVQVLCVTYHPLEGDPARPVTLAGGFNLGGERQVVLDPCLASPVAR